MKTYLVGGAIRDELLGLDVHEKDWVVIGSSPDKMQKLGFKPVGKDFPVFLHPETHEEYALARTERKVAKGYQGFTFYYAPEVTLEDDLKRRDLTINAIAREDDGTLIDPFNGQSDLQTKTFRHISSAFSEDPVRILRVARFASKLPDFQIHPDTLLLMQSMVDDGEVDALTPERVWKEFSRALDYTSPSSFFATLQQCGALEKLWPEITSTQLQHLHFACQHTTSGTIRFTALTGTISTDSLKKLLKRLNVPKNYAQLSLLCSRHHKQYQGLDTSNAEAIVTFLKSIDALRKPQRVTDFIVACTCIIQEEQKNKNDFLMLCLKTISSIDTLTLQEQGLQGQDFADALTQLQINAVDNTIKANKSF